MYAQLQVPSPTTSHRLSLAIDYPAISPSVGRLWADDWPFSRLSTAAAKVIPCTMKSLFSFARQITTASSNFRKSHGFVLGVLLLSRIALVSRGSSSIH